MKRTVDAERLRGALGKLPRRDLLVVLDRARGAATKEQKAALARVAGAQKAR